ncbi:unnamed protein product [Oppiella nova]|uniref:Uncharacterized protein n=1 Tax=Oppiella nova TaxID=334625 RepID=A0A7R9QRA6_9ACAR|nr:unnamed protein product [Oppiella nova]CAG2172515.1 unnamed protein product [Oppiella nova]
MGEGPHRWRPTVPIAPLRPNHNILFVTTDDMVYGLGSNVCGKLELGHNEPIHSPQPIPELCHQKIHTFISGYDFVLAMNSVNHVYSWGPNRWGQLGRNETPEDVYSKAERISFFDDKDVRQISCGSRHSLALTSSGQVYGWGCNSWGQIGCGEQQNDNFDEKETENVLKEVKNLEKVKSEYVVQYYHSWRETGCLYIQMEFCSNSLQNILEVKPQVFERQAGDPMDLYELDLKSY